MTNIYNFGVKPIPCHAWNEDHSQLALSPNSNVVNIYKKDGTNWKLIHTLNEHTLQITGENVSLKSYKKKVTSNITDGLINVY